MTTIYQINSELPAVTAGDVAEADIMHVYDASTKLHSRMTVRDLGSGGLTGAVNTTATSLAVSATAHAGKVVTISSAAPIVVTLPQATGTGNRYRFVWQVAATGTASTIKVGNATDVMQGYVFTLTSSSANVIGYGTTATDDTYTVNGTTKGGIAGAWVEFQDIKTGFFSVASWDAATGTTATPFSAAV